MSKVGIPLQGFKKVAADKNTTTLEHKDGHKITIAHNAVSPKYRGQLAALPMQAPKKMADGGIVADSSNQSASMKENTKKKGLDVESEAQTSTGGVEYEQSLDNDEPAQAKNPVEYEAVDKQEANNTKKVYMADGGDVPDMPNPQPQAAPEQALPDSSNLEEANSSAQPQAPVTINIAAPNSTPMPPKAEAEQPAVQQQAIPQPAAAAMSPQAAPMNPAAAQMAPQDPYGANTSMQVANQGIAEQKAGIAEQQAAQSQLGAKEAAALQAESPEIQKAQSAYQANLADIQAKRADLQHDIDNMHVDPQRYINNMSTGGKIMTAIGMILGGIGSGLTGQRNVVVDNVEHMIDRDIDAQKSELGKKENLLTFNLRQEGNLRDAYAVTKMQMNDIVANQISNAAAQAKSPLAKAAADQARGQLDWSTAQQQGQYVARKTVLGAQQANNPGALDKRDPATLIQFVVPPDKQIPVSAEIKRAQDTRVQEKDILKAFDRAAADLKGLGRASIKTPRSLMAFDQSLQPTFADIEGTVRQSAMDATKENVNPSRIDTDADTAIKRKALETYIHSKKSAPLAKTFGIDLDKFASSNVGAGLPPSGREMEMLDPKSGRTVIVDSVTKKPLRWK